MSLKDPHIIALQERTLVARRDGALDQRLAVRERIAGSQAAIGTVPDATPILKGKVQLAGDIAGTAAAPLIKKLTSLGTTAMTDQIVLDNDHGDLQGYYGINPTPQRWDIRHGTTLAPVTTLGATLKVSRYEDQPSGTNGQETNNYCGISAINVAASTSYAQPVGGVFIARSSSTRAQLYTTSNPDVIGLTAIGATDGGNTAGRAMGAFVEGFSNATGNPRFTALELSTRNNSGTPATWENSLANPACAIVIAHRGATAIPAADRMAEAAIKVGNPFGAQYLVGVGFNSQNPISGQTFRDDGNADTSLQINGTHATAAIGIASGAGNVGIGTLTPGAPLTVNFNGTGSIFDTPSTAQAYTQSYRSAGTAKWAHIKAASDNLVWQHSDATTLMTMSHADRNILMNSAPTNHLLGALNLGIGTWTAGGAGEHKRLQIVATNITGGFNERPGLTGTDEDILTDYRVNTPSTCTSFYPALVQGSTWKGPGLFVGYITNLLHYENMATTAITSMANNGSGKYRVTSTAHGASTGWSATVSGTGTTADGSWVVTVIDADTLDLHHANKTGPAFTSTATGTLQVHRYKEGFGAVFFNSLAAKGQLAVGCEVDVNIQPGSIGRTVGYNVTLHEENNYSAYNDPALVASPGHYTAGSIGYMMHATGPGQVGTGMLFAPGSGTGIATGAFKRAIVVRDRSSFELFCVDGTGNIGVRRTTDYTTTLAAALTVGYTSAGAASTSTADGINFGGEINLYRNATNNLRCDQGLSVAGALNLGNAIFVNVTTGGLGFIELSEQSTTPATPAADKLRLYSADSGGTTVLRYKDSSGTVTTLGAGGGGITTATDSAHIDFTITGSDITGTLLTTATPQFAGLGIGVSGPATGFGVGVNASNAQTSPGQFITATGISHISRTTGNYMVMFNTDTTTYTGTTTGSARFQWNTDQVRLGFSNGTSGATFNEIYKVTASNTLKVSHNFEVTTNLTVGGNTTMTGSLSAASGQLSIVGGGLVLSAGAMNIAAGVNVVLATTTGTKIGTATNQLLGFWNATPVAQPAAVADATGGAVVDTEARAAINTLLARLRAPGFIAT